MRLRKRNLALTTSVIGAGSTFWSVARSLEMGTSIINGATVTAFLCTLIALYCCWQWGISRAVVREEIDWGWGATLMLLLLFVWDQWWRGMLYLLGLLLVLTLFAAALNTADTQ